MESVRDKKCPHCARLIQIEQNQTKFFLDEFWHSECLIRYALSQIAQSFGHKIEIIGFLMGIRGNYTKFERALLVIWVKIAKQENTDFEVRELVRDLLVHLFQYTPEELTNTYWSGSVVSIYKVMSA